MDDARRQRYLKLIGIDTWRPRDAAPVELPDRGVAASPIAPTVRATPVAVAEPEAMPRRPRAVPATAAAPVAAKPRSTASPVVPAGDWAGLREQVRDCRNCKLCETRTNTVFGVGDAHAPLMIVGEGPGADEDAQGEPFVGRAGKLLDEMLKAIVRTRRETDPERAVFIANVVKCRPPGNRDPEADEVDACRPYLDRQIELVKPRLIVALGRIAAQRLLETDAPLSRLRGPLYHYGAAQTPVLVTYHPAYLLRSPREKAKSWEDLKRIHRFLHGT